MLGFTELPSRLVRGAPATSGICNCAIEVAKSSFVVRLLFLHPIPRNLPPTSTTMSTANTANPFSFPGADLLVPTLRESLAAVLAMEAEFREVAAQLANGIPSSWRVRHRKQRGVFVVRSRNFLCRKIRYSRSSSAGKVHFSFVVGPRVGGRRSS